MAGAKHPSQLLPEPETGKPRHPKEPKLSKPEAVLGQRLHVEGQGRVLQKSLAAAWGMRGGFPVCQHAAYMFGCKGVVRQMQPYVLNDTALVTIPKAVSQQQLQHAA